MANLPLYLTFDLFLGLWNKPGELWTCIIPHVVDDGSTNQISTWLKDSADGANFDYQMATYDNALFKDPKNPPVPVPFGDNVNITVDLLNGTPPTTVDRRARLQIVDADQFREENADPSAPSQGSSNIQKMPENAPFARAFNIGLRGDPNINQAPMPADQVRHYMALALWGGSRRWYSNKSLTQLDDAIMVLNGPSGSDPRTMTNLHSMLGLMVRLGRRPADLATLKQVTNIRITLDVLDNNNAVKVISTIDLGTLGAAGQSIPQFFSNLADQDMDPSQVKVAWNSQIEQRAYVRRIRAPFILGAVGPHTVFKRKSDRNATQLLNSLGRLNSLLTPDPNGQPAPNPLPATLSFTPCQVIQGKLQRYRSAPHLQDPSSKTEVPTVLQFSPSLAEAQAFNALIGVDPHLFEATDGRWSILIDDQPQALEFIGRFSFPWDVKDGSQFSYLFRGIAPKSNAATLFAITRAPGKPAPSIVCQVSDFVPESGASLWRGAPGAAVDPVPLEAFLPPPELNSAQIALLKVTGEFSNDIDFELPQSTSQIEDVLTATYPQHGLVAGVPKTPTTLTPITEYQEDLVNYNALNVYTKLADGTLSALNPANELYPVWTTQPQVNPIQHVFHFRYHTAAFRPDRANVDARIFYDQIYSSLSNNRQLVVELEHTFGNVIPFATPRLQLQSVDFPVQLPNGVRIPDSTGANAPKPGPFIWIEYGRGSDKSEAAVLSFNTALLDSKNASNDQLREAYYAAWRSIAELNYADQISLTARLRNFDFSAAIKGKTVRAGLVPSADLADFTISITADVKALTHQLLAGQTVASPLVNIPLRSAAPFIWQVADVVDFVLTVKRPGNVVPPDQPQGQPWQLFWVPDAKNPTATQFDQNGLIVDPAPQFGDQFSAWRGLLLQRERVIHTGPQTDSDYAALRRVLGPDSQPSDDNFDPNDAGAWIATPDDPGADPGRVVAAVCPFGFVPLDSNDFLGSRTDLLMRRYTSLLQNILSLNVQDWLKWAATDWRNFLTKLQTLVGDPAKAQPGADPAFGALFNFVTAMTNMLKPFPNPQAQLNPEINTLVNQLRTPNNPLYTASLADVQEALWADPSVFANTKAFLLTHLRGDAGDIPEDFFDLLSEKLAGTAETVLDSDVLSYRDAVFTVGSGEAAFVELLPEVKYDNDFLLNNFALRRFEYFVKSVDGVTPPSDPSNATFYIPSTLYVPAGQFDPTSKNKPDLWLAAREAIIPPTHLVTDIFDQCQTAAKLDATFPKNSTTPVRFDLAQLKLGKLVQATQATPVYVEMMSRTDTRGRSGYLDTYIISSAFLVVGSEEEAKGDPIQGFTLDQFLADMTVQALVGVAAENASPPQTITANLFSDLAGKPDVTTVSNPLDALDPAVLKDVTAWMTGIAPVTGGPPPGLPTITIAKDGSMTIAPLPGAPSQQPLAEAFLFKIVDTSSTTNANPSYVLFVNREGQRWNRSAIGLIQTRNFQTDIGRNFAADFGQVSQEVSDAAAHQPVVEISVYDNPDISVPPVSLKRQQYSMSDLVKTLLGKLIPIDPTTNEPRRWRDFDLAITIYHDQKTPFPAAYLGSTSETFLATSQYPLQAIRAGARTPTEDEPQIWFVDNYQEYTVDFHWFSEGNLPFFGIQGVRVVVT